MANDFGGGDVPGGTIRATPKRRAHLSLVTSLISGYEIWQFDNAGLIENSKGHFDSAEYDRQLKHGVN